MRSIHVFLSGWLVCWALAWGGQPCGNDTDKDCESDCEEGENGSCAGENKFNAYAGNVSRWVQDMAILGEPVDKGLAFKRRFHSRPNPTSSDFGSSGVWRHNWSWQLSEDSPTRLRTQSPGGQTSYLDPDTNSAVLAQTVYGGGAVFRGDRDDTSVIVIRPDGAECCLLEKDGTRWYFVAWYQGSTRKWQLDRVLDSYERAVVFYYDGARRMTRVEGPSGRGFFINWRNWAVTNLTDAHVSGAVTSVPPAGQWVRIAIKPAYKDQYWTIRAADGKRLSIAELRLIGTNDAVIAGQPIGSSPLSAGFEKEAAFDNDENTAFYSSDVTGGYVGLQTPTKTYLKALEFKAFAGSESNLVGASVESYFAYRADHSLIDHVSSDDGRTVGYRYSEWADPNLTNISYLLFDGADYEDGSQATYTYEQVLPHIDPLLVEANDVRYEGRLQRVQYTYHTGENQVMGMIRQEVDPVTGGVMAELTTDGSQHRPMVVYPNGASKVYHMGYGVLTRTVDQAGRTNRFTYNQDGRGHLISHTDPLGNTTTYERDTLGRKLRAVYPDGSAEGWSYDGLGRLLAHTNELGGVTRYTRATNGLPLRIDYPDGTYETFVYNALGQVLQHRTRAGGTATQVYDAQGLRLSATDEVGETTVYSNGVLGLPVAVTDPRGYTTHLDYDSRGHVTNRIYADGGRASYVFDARGNQLARVDEYTNTWLTLYDHFDRKTTSMDPMGNTTTWSYDYLGSGCGCSTKDSPTDIISPSLRRVRFEYDADWRVLSKTEAHGTSLATTNRYAYDANGRRIREIDPLGAITTFGYDTRGRQVAVTNALGQVTRYEYDAMGNRTKEILPDGSFTRYEYNSAGQLTKIIDPLNQVVGQTYNANGQLATRTDARGFTESFAYDVKGRLLQATHADGTIVRMEYDAAGNLAAQINELGQTVTNTFDHANRKTTSVDALGRTNRVIYGPGASTLTLAQIAPSGKRTDYLYDRAQRRVGLVRASGTAEESIHSYVLDADGRVQSESDGLGQVTTFTYDELGRVISSANAVGETNTFLYDAAGHRLATIRPDGGTTTNAYDALGRVVATTDAQAGTIRYEYDSRGRMNRLVDAKGNETTWTYDAAGRLSAKTYDDGHGVNYAYDPNGNLISATWARGTVRYYTYDNRNRLTAVQYSDATPNVTLTYDAAGRVLSRGSTAASYTYTYDAAGQSVSEIQQIGATARTLGYTYDSDGNLVGLVYPDGSSVAYAYNARNRLGMVTRNGDAVATYAYDPEDRVVSLLRGNGVQTTNVYDAVGRMLVTAHLGPGGVPLEAVQYGYDTVGRRTYAMFGDDVGDRFAYDALDQVTGVVYDIVRPDVNLGPGSGHEQTEYDAMGNRDTFMTDANTNLYTANGLNQYTAIDGAALTYDLDGNLVFDNQGRTLSWDGENRLRSVAPISLTNGAVKVEMSYDDQSRRVGKTVSVRTNGVWVQQSDAVFTYQGWNLISEIRSQGSGVSTNVYIWGRDLSGSLQGVGGVGGLLCSYSTLSSSLHFFSYDGSGNVILLTDAAGAVEGRYRYQVFGALRSMTGLAAAENPYRFSTKYIDNETGLLYYGFRYYSPEKGRWVNRDPIGEFSSLNVQVAFNNNPVSKTDFLGLSDNDPPDEAVCHICGSEFWDPDAECCENDKVVQKEKSATGTLCCPAAINYQTIRHSLCIHAAQDWYSGKREQIQNNYDFLTSIINELYDDCVSQCSVDHESATPGFAACELKCIIVRGMRQKPVDSAYQVDLAIALVVLQTRIKVCDLNYPCRQ